MRKLLSTALLAATVSGSLAACGAEPLPVEEEPRAADEGGGSTGRGGTGGTVSQGGTGGTGGTGGGSAGEGGSGGTRSAIGSGLEIFDVVGDGDVLVVRGRGLRQAVATLEQGGSQLPLEILSSTDYELRLALPTVVLAGSANLVVRVGNDTVRREVVLIRGPMGQQGTPGATGLKGDKGDKGDEGPAGPQGPVGPQGPQGERGPAGPQGLRGPQGERGLQGLQGARGATGAQGARGPAGQDNVLGMDLLSAGSGTQYLTNSISWQPLGLARTVTVNGSSSLLIFVDVGGVLDPPPAFGTASAFSRFEFAVKVDGTVISQGAYAMVRGDGERSASMTVSPRRPAGNHTVQLVGRCKVGTSCRTASLDLAAQRMLVLQVND